MNEEMAGKRVIVTGASSGIGRATAELLLNAGGAEEIADLICFLASDRAAWITGATVSIDGGRALTCAR
jgi:NAD(P)-dependent dehydrogenase (short-subunit alcohol dehydrogenase family)